MNKPQSLIAPKNGAQRVEKSRRAATYEAVVISVFLLSLFLAGCGPAPKNHIVMSAIAVDLPVSETRHELLGPGRSSAPTLSSEPIIEKVNSDLKSAALSKVIREPETASERLLVFSQEEAVQVRVRLVLGWLEFYGAKETLNRAKAGWERVQAGKLALTEAELKDSPMNSDGDSGRFSRLEFDVWRELLEPPSDVKALAAPADFQEIRRKLVTAAWLLTAATIPEEIQDVDKLLIESSPGAN